MTRTDLPQGPAPSDSASAPDALHGDALRPEDVSGRSQGAPGGSASPERRPHRWPGSAGETGLGPSAMAAAPTFDVVSIRNLRAWTLIGIHPHERDTRQEIRIDARIGTDTRTAAARDDIALAIDYSEVSRAFREHAGGAAHLLVETLAEELAKIALERFGALAIQLTVEKPGAVPGADAVGVTIERHRVPEAVPHEAPESPR